jgi:peptidyl-tRNA hydrolase
MAKVSSTNAIKSFSKSSDDEQKLYMFSGQPKVCLKSRPHENLFTENKDLNKAHSAMLFDLSEKADDLGLNYANSFKHEIIQSLVIGPNEEKLIDKVTGELKLY